MRPVSIKLKDMAIANIQLGFVGENNATQVVFDCKEIFDENPYAVQLLVVTPPEGTTYEVTTARIGDDVVWNVSELDTAYAGDGSIQLVFTDGNTVIKTYNANTTILEAQVPSGTAPATALNWIQDAEAWAKGTRGGRAVESDDPTYQNNSKYYSQQIVDMASDSEAYAKGTRNGEAVESDDPAYHNNSKYYAESIADAASDSEAYAAGTRGGEAVDEDDPAYHNNAAYYNDQAALEKAAAQAAAETASAAYNVNLLAANYDATKTYAVGEYVIYSGGLYRCISAIMTAEAWTSGHWASVTVGKDTSALKSATDNKIDIRTYPYGYAEYLNDLEKWEKGYIDNATGQNGSATSTTGKARIRTKGYITGIEKIVRIDGTDTVMVLRYTSEDVFVDSIGFNSYFEGFDYTNYQYRLCLKRTSNEELAPALEKYVLMASKTDFASGKAVDVMNRLPITEPLLKGYYLSVNKTIGTTLGDIVVSSSNWNCFRIPVKANDKFIITDTSGSDVLSYGFTDAGTTPSATAWADKGCKLLSKAKASTALTNEVITATEDGWLLVNQNLNTDFSLISYAPQPLASDLDAVKKEAAKIPQKADSGALPYGYAGLMNDPDLWQAGYIDAATGENGSPTSTYGRMRIRTTGYITGIEGIVRKDGAQAIYVLMYDSNDDYVGYEGPTSSFFEFDYSTYNYRLSVSRTTDESKADGLNRYALLATPFDQIKASKFRKSIAWGNAFSSDWYEGQGESYSGFGTSTQYSAMVDAWDALMEESDGYITRETIGTASDETSTMYLYKLIPTAYRNMAINEYNRPPKVIVVPSLHGFEKSAAFGAYYFARDLVHNYDKNPVLNSLRTKCIIYVVPVGNPYGFNNNLRKNANGVDLNRNWGTPDGTSSGGSTDPDSPYYAGEEPFDQPETQAIKAVIDANLDIILLVDFHTNGQYKVSSWANVNWISLGHRVISDMYCRKTYTAAVSQIAEITENFIKEYNLDTNGDTIGNITIGSARQTTFVTIGGYCATVNVCGNTFEGNNGFPSESGSYSADEQKANSELLGNWIKNVLNSFYGT